jgi:4-hydroxy-tetrahydrodipicolinate synthase
MREGRWADALELQDRLFPLHAALFSDASPAPTKYAVRRVLDALSGDFPAELRLPLVEASDDSKRKVDAALEHARLI